MGTLKFYSKCFLSSSVPMLFGLLVSQVGFGHGGEDSGHKDKVVCDSKKTILISLPSSNPSEDDEKNVDTEVPIRTYTIYSVPQDLYEDSKAEVDKRGRPLKVHKGQTSQLKIDLSGWKLTKDSKNWVKYTRPSITLDGFENIIEDKVHFLATFVRRIQGKPGGSVEAIFSADGVAEKVNIAYPLSALEKRYFGTKDNKEVITSADYDCVLVR